MDKEREDIVTLLDEEGIEHDFIVIDVLPMNENEYAILVPVNYYEEEGEGDNEEEAVIFKIVDENGERILVTVDDEEEWKNIALAWEKKIQCLEPEEEIENLDGD